MIFPYQIDTIIDEKTIPTVSSMYEIQNFLLLGYVQVPTEEPIHELDIGIVNNFKKRTKLSHVLAFGYLGELYMFAKLNHLKSLLIYQQDEESIGFIDEDILTMICFWESSYPLFVEEIKRDALEDRPDSKSMTGQAWLNYLVHSPVKVDIEKICRSNSYKIPEIRYDVNEDGELVFHYKLFDTYTSFRYEKNFFFDRGVNSYLIRDFKEFYGL